MNMIMFFFLDILESQMNIWDEWIKFLYENSFWWML